MFARSCSSFPEPNKGLVVVLALAWIALGMSLGGCSSKPVAPPALIAAPPPPTVAKIAIPVACEIAQVPFPAYPGDLVQAEDDVFVLARLVTADRRVRIAERDRLRAANATPCPAR